MKRGHNMLTGVAGVAVVLVLASCDSGGGTAQKTTPSDSTSSSAVAFPDEGSVATADGRFIAYPGGFRIDFVSAERFSSADVERAVPGSYDVETGNERDVAADSVAVKVTLKYTNGSPEHLPVEGMQMMHGFSGVNRLPVDTINWAGDNVFAQNPMPTRIASGSSQLFWITFEVPETALSTFVVRPALLGEYTPYTFTDIAKALT